MTGEVLRYAAFPDEDSTSSSPGNPAGVVLGAETLTEAQMQTIAETIGYSETAFLAPIGPGSRDEFRTRYFSPKAEVDFCGHATIAAAVAVAERHGAGDVVMVTNAGRVTVRTQERGRTITATLTSPATSSRPVAPRVLTAALSALRLSPESLDPRYPARVAFAGNHHLVLGVTEAHVLDDLDYDYVSLDALMALEGWTTVHVFHHAGHHLYTARNAFPPGGVREDPATGAAAAAFGGYLRELGLVEVPCTVTVLQGHQMGSPSRLMVGIDGDHPGIEVTGTATRLSPSPYDEIDLP